MHESTIYLTTLIELFVHIDCEKHSLRVLTPCETTKDKLANILLLFQQLFDQSTDALKNQRRFNRRM